MSDPAEEISISEQKHTNSSGILALQWLTYAFWFWFIIGVGWLSGIVASYYETGEAASGRTEWASILAYPLAAVIITGVVALVTDLIYSKHEPSVKKGGANVIMLLHLVPFILVSIGAMIVTVFLMINMTLDSVPGSALKLVPSTVIMLLSGLAAMRVFFGSRKKLRLGAWIGFGAIAVGFIVAGIAGPMMTAIATKDDRLIESAMPELVREINEYAGDKNKLPATLADIVSATTSSSEEVQQLIDRELVTYKPSTNPLGELSDTAGTTGTLGVSYYDSEERRLYYQLCVTFKYAKKDRYNNSIDNTHEPASYLYINSHPKGEVCYDLYTTNKKIPNGFDSEAL